MKRRRVPQSKVQTVITLAAPSRGLNTTGDVAMMPPTDAIELDNLIAAELGLTVRGGWQEYATNIGAAVAGDGKPIRSVFSFDEAPPTSFAAPNASSTLFAATDDGIYLIEGGGDFTGTAPDIALSGALGAGYLSTIQFTTTGGAQYLIACSETDGGFIYDGSMWVKMTSVGGPGPSIITGVDPSLFVQVCTFKKRLMFVRRMTGEAWFLPVGQVGGVASVFDFGPMLRRGGTVLALINWTQDAGDGVDDRLVILGSSGDVVVYQGTDPSNPALFSLVGVWFIGQPPVGRRCFTSTGGNIYILTQFGVIPIAQLMAGGLDNILLSDSDLLKQLRKLQDILNTDFQTQLNVEGWQLINIPSLAILQIARPGVSTTDQVQYVFQQHSLAWSRIRDVPGFVWALRLNETYAGCLDGRVLRVFNDTSDGMLLDGSGAYEIRARVTPAFNYFGAPAVRKRALMIRPQFLTSAAIGWSAQMNVDFEVKPLIGSTATGADGGALWDSAIWDSSVWAGGRNAVGEWRSVTGLGYALTPSIFVSSSSRTTLASIEYMLDAGGPL